MALLRQWMFDVLIVQIQSCHRSHGGARAQFKKPDCKLVGCQCDRGFACFVHKWGFNYSDLSAPLLVLSISI